MFSITTLDLVRLDSDHAAQNYMVHARAAERSARAAFTIRIVVVSLLAAACASSIFALLLPVRAYEIAAVVFATLALVAFAIYATLGLESRVGAHRQIAHRLWLIAERYRALLAEVNDGLVDGPQALRRRDELKKDLHAIYEQSFGPDQPARESARLPRLPADRAA